MKNQILWFFMGFPGFPYFWRKFLGNGRKSSGGGCARPKKRRSSPSGGAKVVSGVVFLSADMFRSREDIYFFMGETLAGTPPGRPKVKYNHPPLPSSRWGRGVVWGSLLGGSWGALSGVSPTEKYTSSRDPNMSADKNTAPETTFPPPDGLERRFLDPAHLPPLLFRPFDGIFGQKYEKLGKAMIFMFFMIFMVFHDFGEQCSKMAGKVVAAGGRDPKSAV